MGVVATVGHESKLGPLCGAWIIRRRDGAVLPMFTQTGTRSRRAGFSFDEPAHGVVPRMFKTKQAAKNALIAWLRGRWSHKEYESDDWTDQASVVAWHPVPQESRRAEDMEVVEVLITMQEG